MNLIRSNRRALFLGGAALAIALSAPAQAQNSGGEESPAANSEIVVTGTLIRQKTVSSPLSVVSGGEIAARAVTNPAELVATIPGNAGSEAGVDQLNQPLTSGTAQFNLRNLGLGSTLVLVNNRRQTLSAVAAGDGSTFVDINSLVPLIAIQRIEVVKDGGGATYGSDAVAGVVNFITRTRVDRPEITARMNFIDGASQVDIQGIAGVKAAGGDLVLAASYYKSTRLGTNERDFSQAKTFGRPSWHSVSGFGMPGSYILPGGSTVADPDCLNAAFPDSFKNSPTDRCRFDFSGYFDLIPQERRIQAMATWNGSVADGVELNLEGAYANSQTFTASSPSFPILATSPVVPASNPFNPFGQDVRFVGRLLNGAYGPSITLNEYDTFRLAAGLTGKLAPRWTWSVNATYSQQAALYDKPDTLKTRLLNALRGFGGANCDPLTGVAGAGSCSYFNPFGSAYVNPAKANSPELVRSLIGYSGLRGKASLVTFDGLVSGDVADFGGGTIQAALGAQYRRSTFRHDWGDYINAGELITLGQAPDFSGAQEVTSVFGEAKVPLTGLADLTLSGRYEKYADSFSRFTPKVSLLVRPLDVLTLRASWGKAFRAPSVFQLSAVQTAQPSVQDGAGNFIFVNTQTFGDPSLRPEKSTNWNLGATFAPVSGLELNLDYWDFRYEDLIVKENPQPIINAARAGDTAALARVTRDINGTLTLVKLRFVNASSVKVAGIDASARYRFETGIGQFQLNADWTRVTRYDIQLSAGAAPLNGLGSVNFNNLGRSMPRDRVEYGLNWSLGASAFNVRGHYVSPYTNDRTGITNARIGAWNSFDLQYNRTFSGIAGGTTLSLGVVNVFDKSPPVAQLNLGFDPIVHDPRGRVFTVALNQKF
ncbi:MAG: TonB-dependent receptor [Sphingomonadales bacterium]|nr:TonB-dependent receptor [Sphingomonadales bacterium]